jgi:hypothetical protein
MAQLVCAGAVLQCSFGAAPSTLQVQPAGQPVNACNMAAATTMDCVPTKNIPPFGVCSSLSNPQVAAATTAAQGVLTPQPCVPVTIPPWAPGSPTVLIANMPALSSTSTVKCSWLGVITITAPGQMTVLVP